MHERSNSYCNGPNSNSGNSACNGNNPVQIRHDWHCPCHWCLVGHK